MKIGSGAYEMYRTERKAKTTRILSKHVQYRTQPTRVEQSISEGIELTDEFHNVVLICGFAGLNLLKEILLCCSCY